MKKFEQELKQRIIEMGALAESMVAAALDNCKYVEILPSDPSPEPLGASFVVPMPLVSLREFPEVARVVKMVSMSTMNQMIPPAEAFHCNRSSHLPSRGSRVVSSREHRAAISRSSPATRGRDSPNIRRRLRRSCWSSTGRLPLQSAAPPVRAMLGTVVACRPTFRTPSIGMLLQLLERMSKDTLDTKNTRCVLC